VAVPAACTQKKKKTVTTSAKQNLDLLSGIDEESIYLHNPPPEDMPSYVPYLKRNTPRVTRAATRTPPTLLYVPSLSPIADNDCNPLDHKSPHKDPPAEFVEKVARAADLFHTRSSFFAGVSSATEEAAQVLTPTICGELSPESLPSASSSMLPFSRVLMDCFPVALEDIDLP
jgi:hypothetical protein